MVSANGVDSNLRYERHGKNVRIYNPDAPKNSIGSAGSLVRFDSKAEADAFVKQHTPEGDKSSTWKKCLGATSLICGLVMLATVLTKGGRNFIRSLGK